MPKIRYQEQRFSASSRALIDTANKIIADYQAQGFDLTLRQLYYQFVARDIIANQQSEYKRLGSVINDARLAGLIDWHAIVDRTRNLRRNSHWNTPGEIVQSCAEQFQLDKWATQQYRVEVWIEKDALVGVVEQTCAPLDVPYFSCRGYTSQSEMWEAAQRLHKYARSYDQTPVIIHLGDHDPSGLDMTRDITDRLALFMGGMEVNRIALNMSQIEEFNPPPNPAKITDSRAAAYIALHGDESWELDALDPAQLAELIQSTVEKYRDDGAWEVVKAKEDAHRARLAEVAATL
jgi:hypothetical protein